MRYLDRAVTAALAAVLAVVTADTVAQNYPVKPVRMIVPFPAGGATDLMGRLIGQKLGEAFGHQVVVENRGGANGTLGLDVASKAAPDGYTPVQDGVTWRRSSARRSAWRRSMRSWSMTRRRPILICGRPARSTSAWYSRARSRSCWTLRKLN